MRTVLERFTCDFCHGELEVSVVRGLTAPLPDGWTAVTVKGGDAGVFCSVECAERWCHDYGKET